MFYMLTHKTGQVRPLLYRKGRKLKIFSLNHHDIKIFLVNVTKENNFLTVKLSIRDKYQNL